jgi:hypothetical protein
VTFPVGSPLEEIERQMILRTLDKTGNNKTRAAELLEISLKTLHNKLNSYRAQGSWIRNASARRSAIVTVVFYRWLGIGTRGPHNPFDGLAGVEPLAVFQNESPQFPLMASLPLLTRGWASKAARKAPRARRPF